MSRRSGYFLIADISGYTRFLADSELEHAQDIIQTLLNSLVEGIAPPMKLAKFEGDAVFCYAPAEAVVRPQTILDGIDDIYSRFSGMRERITRNTTCPCQACRRTADLNLKFVLHHGEYVEQSIAAHCEIAGTAVIVVHRLMKNHIRESTGIDAYLFVTEAAAQALGEIASPAGRIRHDEAVEGIGRVSGWVSDMAPVWRRRREQERAWISPAELLWFPPVGNVLPISPAAAWSYLLDTDQRLRWIGGMTGMTVDGRPDGRVDEGSVLHCAHGAEIRNFEIVDWRPFESFSWDQRFPLGPVVRTTFDLTRRPDGTYVELRLRPVRSGKGPFAHLVGSFLLDRARRKVRRSVTHNMAALVKLVGEDLAAGRIERWQPAKGRLEKATVPAF
jgi:uncharacterized protein YndB with AHSA1/START domain